VFLTFPVSEGLNEAWAGTATYDKFTFTPLDSNAVLYTSREWQIQIYTVYEGGGLAVWSSSESICGMLMVLSEKLKEHGVAYVTRPTRTAEEAAGAQDA